MRALFETSKKFRIYIWAWWLVVFIYVVRWW
jgi:hypothetical protein